MLADTLPGEIIELASDKGRNDGFGDLVDPFRRCMRLLAGGVSIVTGGLPGHRIGLTATSVTSLSMEPPSLLVSVRAGSRLVSVVMREERFTVHLLAEHQALAAEVFAGRLGDGRPRIEQVDWHERSGGRLAGALSYVECRLARVVPVFTHALLIGVVEVVESGSGMQPLVHFDGCYHRLAQRYTD